MRDPTLNGRDFLMDDHLLMSHALHLFANYQSQHTVLGVSVYLPGTRVNVKLNITLSFSVP